MNSWEIQIFSIAIDMPIIICDITMHGTAAASGGGSLGHL